MPLSSFIMKETPEALETAVFEHQQTLPGPGAIYHNTETSLTLPEYVIVRHSEVKPKGSSVIVDKHNIVFSRKERDATNGEIHEAAVSITVTAPRNDVFSNADYLRLYRSLHNHLSDVLGDADSFDRFVQLLRKGT